MLEIAESGVQVEKMISNRVVASALENLTSALKMESSVVGKATRRGCLALITNN